MDLRTLGRNGPQVSALGFGGMALSGGYEPVDERDARNTVARALELGVTMFDTADFYTKGTRTATAEWGHNEKLIGDCLKGRRNEIVLSTKGGYTFDANGAIAVNGRPDYLRAACEGSLRRLKVETIDVYYLHRVDPEVPVAESIGSMADLVSEGKVRWLGLSEAAPNDIRSACAVHPVTALQYEYSLLNRDPEAEILPLCRELGIGLVPFSPLCRGMLSGAIHSVEDMDESDWRRSSAPRFSKEHLAKNLALVSRLAELADRLDATVAQVAIAWILHQGDDITPMIGATRPEYVTVNSSGASLRLTPEVLAEIAAIFPPGAAAGARFPEAFQKAVRQ